MSVRLLVVSEYRSLTLLVSQARLSLGRRESGCESLTCETANVLLSQNTPYTLWFLKAYIVVLHCMTELSGLWPEECRGNVVSQTRPSLFHGANSLQYLACVLK